MSTVDLLMELQYNFPLCSKPFHKIAERLSEDVQNVIRTVAELKSRGVIRRIGTVLNYKARELVAALVGLSVPDPYVEDVAQNVRTLGGVSHNFIREHNVLNMWFVIKRRSVEEIVQTVKKIVEKFSIKDFVILKSMRTFRLDVKFDLREGISRAKILTLPENIPKLEDVTDLSVDILRELFDIEICEEPFNKICERYGIDVERLLDNVRKLIELGVLRDFYAVLNQEAVGFKVNAMVIVESECTGEILKLPEPTHIVERRLVCGTVKFGEGCYLMLHAVDRELIEQYIKNRVEKLGKKVHVLYSVKNLLPEMPHDIEYSR